MNMNGLETIKIHGVPSVLKNNLRTIAKNKGVTMSGDLKNVLRQYVRDQPDRLRSEQWLD